VHLPQLAAPPEVLRGLHGPVRGVELLQHHGGRPESAYANQNAFSLIQPDRNVARLNSEAINGLSTLSRMDPVLSPLPFPEIGRHVTNIVSGLAL